MEGQPCFRLRLAKARGSHLVEKTLRYMRVACRETEPGSQLLVDHQGATVLWSLERLV